MKSYLFTPLEYSDRAFIFSYDIFGRDDYISCRRDIEGRGYFVTQGSSFGSYYESFKEGYRKRIERMRGYFIEYA